MPDYRRTFCRENRGGCGKNAVEVGPISWTGLCQACGNRRANENFDALTTHSGPGFDLWRARMARCVGGALLDELRSTP